MASTKFSRRQAAALIGVSVSALVNWEKAGKLKHLPQPARYARNNRPLYSQEVIDAIKEWAWAVIEPSAK